MLVDSHTHLNFKVYDKDRVKIIARCQNMKLINIGTDFKTSKEVMDLASENDNFYATIGLHPSDVRKEEFNILKYQELIKKDKVVAIGETGLDYWHHPEERELQIASFLKHIKLAQGNNLPLVIHCRNGQDHKTAYQDIYDILKDNNMNKGAIHCYGGNLAEAHKFIELGLYLGFTGIITFDKTGLLEEIIKEIPLERILIETDAPFLAPVPFRGKRNEPSYVKYVAQKIAEIKNMEVEEVIELTGHNAIKLFNLK